MNYVRWGNYILEYETVSLEENEKENKINKDEEKKAPSPSFFGSSNSANKGFTMLNKRYQK